MKKNRNPYTNYNKQPGYRIGILNQKGCNADNEKGKRETMEGIELLN